jgi:hypothetical protein
MSRADADKTKHDDEQIHYISTDNTSFENAAKFRYFRTIVTHQDYIH